VRQGKLSKAQKASVSGRLSILCDEDLQYVINNVIESGEWHLAELMAVESDFVLDARALTSGAHHTAVHLAACERTHRHLT
jgi:hypothetical protein